MTNVTLGGLELAILLAVVRLGDDAYGLSVRRDVSARSGRDYSVGAIYTTLERLEMKGLVRSRTTAPTATRGGRSRRQFTVTANGQRAIRRAEHVARSVWYGMATVPKPETA